MFMRYLGGGIGHQSTRYLSDRFLNEAQPPGENNVNVGVEAGGKEGEGTDGTEIIGEEEKEEEEGEEEEEEEEEEEDDDTHDPDTLGPEDGEDGDYDAPENEGYGVL